MANNLSKVQVVFDAQISELTKKLKVAEKDLAKFGKKAKTAKAETTKLSGSFSKAANSASILLGPLNGVSGRLSSISAGLTRINPLLLAFGAAASASIGIMIKATQAGSEYTQQMLRLEALVKTTGGAAGVTAKQMDDLAVSIARGTLASAAGVRDAAGVLATFKTVTGDNFERVLRLSQDMSAVIGTDMKSSVLQLGKALESPITGITALTKAGITFSEAEKEKIRLMVESGEAMEAQAVILDKVAGQVGGAGEAESGGMAGAVDTLNEEFGIFLITLSQVVGLESAAISFFTNASAAVRGLGEALEGEANFDNVVAKIEELEELQSRSFLGGSGNSQLEKERAQAIVYLTEHIDKQTALGENEIELEAYRTRKLLKINKQFAKDLEALQTARAESAQGAGTDVAFARNQAELERLYAVRTKLEKDAADDLGEAFKARINGEKQQAERALQTQADIAAKKQKEAVIQIAKYQNAVNSAEQNALKRDPTKQIEAENARFKAVVTRSQMEHDLNVKNLGENEELNLLHQQKIEAYLTEHHERLRGIRAKANLDQINEDAVGQAVIDKAKEDNRKDKEDQAKAEVKMYKASLRAGQMLFSTMADLAGEGTREQKVLLALEKSMALARAMMSMQVAIGKASEEGTIYTKAFHIAEATTIGLGAINSIRSVGIAHAGATNIPEESTYLLSRGERVVAPEQNKDLTRFLSEGGGGAVTINNYGAEVETNRTDNGLEIIVRAARDSVFAELESGGKQSRGFEKRYGLNRRGG